MASTQSGISNPDLHFQQLIKFSPDHLEADNKMKNLEELDARNRELHEKNYFLEARRKEYALLGANDFKEAVVEAYLGNSTKMDIYAAKVKIIKERIPKPEGIK